MISFGKNRVKIIFALCMALGLAPLAMFILGPMKRTPSAFKKSTMERKGIIRNRKPAASTNYLFYSAGKFYKEEPSMDFGKCPVDWNWTTNKEDADALWFNSLDHGASPQSRVKPEQLLVYMSMESVFNYPHIFTMKGKGFDILVDYRIWPDNPAGTADIPAVYLFFDVFNPKIFDMDFRAPPKFPKRQDAFMAAFISNCRPHNSRNELLDALMKVMPVHSYGKCRNNIEEPSDKDYRNMITRHKKAMLGSSYYFVLAAENSNDLSYVTEKVYHALMSGALPVYLGAADINRFLPDPSSIVNVGDFRNYDELAKYLLKLVHDRDAYMQHFHWKNKTFSDTFLRVQRLGIRSVQCRLAMHLEGLDFESGMDDVDLYSLQEN